MNRLERATEFIRQNLIPKVERPVYHLTPPTGWMNDPNGFSVYKDRIHLFYQFHPYSDAWGPMHWGHAVTKDFLQWTDLPVALAPDETYDNLGCFSGTAVVDHDLQYLIYTGSEHCGRGETRHLIQQQCLAEGDGQTYTKSSNNPIISAAMLPPGYSDTDFRDPKVFRHNGRWWLAAAAKTKEGLGDILLYASADLRNWEFVSVLLKNDGTLGDMWECPDYFVFGPHQEVLMASPMHVRNAGPHFHDGYGTVALIGELDWDTKSFHAVRRVPVDYGVDFYAPQTTRMPDGRRILVAWMQAWENFIKPKEIRWHGMMTFPREVEITDGVFRQKPVRELAQAYADTIMRSAVLDDSSCSFDGICGRAVDLTVQLTAMAGDSFCIRFAQMGSHDARLIWRPEERTLTFDRSRANDYRESRADMAFIQSFPVGGTSRELSMRLLLDICSVEVFLEDGDQTFSSTFYAPAAADGIVFESSGRAEFSVTLHTLRIPDTDDRKD